MVSIKMTIEADDPEIAREIALAAAEVMHRRTGDLRITGRPPEKPRLRLVDPGALTAGGGQR